MRSAGDSGDVRHGGDVGKRGHRAGHLSSAPLGLNTAPWDYVYAANTSAGGMDVIQPLLTAAGVDMLRYGGGSVRGW